MWDEIDDRLALLELLVTGALPRRKRQARAHDWLATLPWTRATSRRGELALVTARRGDVVELIDRVWPRWRDEHLALLEAGHPPTPSGWRALEDARRARRLPHLPTALNRRTAASLTGPGAKSSLTPTRRDALGPLEVRHDGLIRLRPPGGMRARNDELSLELDHVTRLFDEVGVADRALERGLTLEGEIDGVLLIENLGAWRDMTRPTGWMLAHIPGWDIRGATALLARLPPTTVLHFGDLDPNGARIARHLGDLIPRLEWFVPDFWRDYIADHARATEWPDELDLDDAPALVRQLARDGLWLEQEPIVLDSRLPTAILAHSTQRR